MKLDAFFARPEELHATVVQSVWRVIDWWKSSAAALLCALWVYVAYRAANMSITTDEAITALWHVQDGVYTIITLHNHHLVDNNHVLFTLLAKLGVSVFGNTEFALRLPSVLSYGLYCFALFSIISRHTSSWRLVLYLSFLAANPFIVDMFSIARGYGLGIALATCGIFFMLRSVESHDYRSHHRDRFFATLAFSLAALAQLTLLPILCGYLIVLFFICSTAIHGYSRLNIAKQFLLPATPALILGSFFAYQVVTIKRNGNGFTDEGKTSFLADTVTSLVDGSLCAGPCSPLHITFVSSLIFVIVVTTVVIALIRMKFELTSKNPDPVYKALMAVITILLYVCASTVAQHHIIGVGYLSGRRATPLIPLFGLTCFFLLLYAGKMRSQLARWVVTVLLSTTPILAVANYFRLMNTNHTIEWPFAANAKDVFDIIYSYQERKILPVPTRIGAAPPLHDAILYYIDQKCLNNKLNSEYINEPKGVKFDAYYAFTWQILEAEQSSEALRIVAQYPQTGTQLAIPASSPIK